MNQDKSQEGVSEILSLRMAEHHMLQVLISDFTLEWVHDGLMPGVQLTVKFDDSTPSIWRRQAREAVKARVGSRARFDAIAQQLDTKIASFFRLEESQRQQISIPGFLFRYGNGGTLPILRIGEQEYYCLAYRDIEPIGWNLANGGSDSRFELLNPRATIERELREELLIINPERGVRYSLQWEDDIATDRPGFLHARRFWLEKLEIDIGAYSEEVAPVTWIHGSDSIVVRTPDTLARETKGVFLNISAADYAIEVDKIAKIHVGPGAVVLDGEMHGSQMVDRPMGLFEVEQFANAFQNGSREFVPDVLFCSGERIDDRIQEAILSACATGSRPLREPEEDSYWDKCVGGSTGRNFNLFDLCPVTRQLVARHLAREKSLMTRPAPHAGGAENCDVFISACGESPDREIARQINDHLRRSRRVFYYEDEFLGMSWLRTIENALKVAKYLVVVCTNIERVRRLDFEWEPFFLWTRYGTKPQGEILPVVHEMKPHELPLPLCMADAVVWGSDDSLSDLSERLP